MDKNEKGNEPQLWKEKEMFLWYGQSNLQLSRKELLDAIMWQQRRIEEMSKQYKADMEIFKGTRRIKEHELHLLLCKAISNKKHWPFYYRALLPANRVMKALEDYEKDQS